MSINEAQTDDIVDHTLLGDIGSPVQAPSPIPQTKKPITIIPENKQLYGQAMQLEEDFEKKLPSMDVAFKLVDGDKEKIVDLEEVEQTISQGGAMSQDIANHADLSFENIFTGVMAKEHFTQSPSGVNFAYVKDRMRERISLEEMSMVKNFALFVDKPIESMSCLLNDLLENYRPTLRFDTMELQELAVALPEKLLKSQNLIVQCGKDFVNLSKIDLTQPQTELLHADGLTSFVNLVGLLSSTLDDAKLKALVYYISSGRTAYEGSSKDAQLNSQESPITLKHLVDYFASSEALAVVDSQFELLQMSLDNLKKLSADSTGILEDKEKIRSFLTENGLEISRNINNQTTAVKSIFSLVRLTFVANQLFEFFEKR